MNVYTNMLTICSWASYSNFLLPVGRISKCAVYPTCTCITDHPEDLPISTDQTFIDDTSNSSKLDSLKEKLDIRDAFVPFNSSALSSDLRI